MGTLLTPLDQAPATITPSVVREQLERILSCPSFQKSRRYPRFLKFIVNKAVSDEAEEIKERTLGVEVFDRPLGYDPATDPVVRLVAGEIRKRLAQYYVQEGHENELRIEIPLGSYVPAFRWPQPPTVGDDQEAAVQSLLPDHATAEAPSLSVPIKVSSEARNPIAWMPVARTYRLAVAIAVCAALAAGSWAVFVRQNRPRRMLDAFWKPILTTGTSTLICVGDQGSQYVGPYDLGALAQLSGMLGSKNRAFVLLLASNATYTDLRVHPGILIGAYNNKWTATVLSGARYQFRGDTGSHFIVDTRNPKKRDWTEAAAAEVPMAVSQDEGLVSRMVSPTTGQIELVIAGIGRCGTTAASEFVTNPYYFKQFAQRAPRGWEKRNIQIVVSTTVINERSGPPRMVAFDLQ
jgi:hypothetical protein